MIFPRRILTASCPCIFRIASATDFQCEKRSRIKNQNTKTANKVNRPILQTRTKLQKPIKGVLNWCKLQVIFTSQNKNRNNFGFKDPIPQAFTPDIAHKFQCVSCSESYYEEYVRQKITKSDVIQKHRVLHQL